MSPISGNYLLLPDGNRLYVRTAGEKCHPIIVLIHGVNLCGAYWSCLQTVLAKAGYYVLAYDLPGHGFSNPWTLPTLPPPAAPIPALMQYYSNLIHQATTLLIGDSPFTLIGNSMGGFVVQIYALQHGDRLENLVLLDTSPKFAPDATGFWMPPQYTPSPSVLPIFLALTLGDLEVRQAILEASVTSSFPEATYTPEQQAIYIAQYQKMLAQLNQTIGVLEIDSLIVGDLRALIPGINVRTLIINGGVLREIDGLVYGDSIAPWGASQYMNELIVSQLVIFSDLGHTPHTEDYPRVAKQLLAWLKSDNPIKPCVPFYNV